MPEQKKTIVIVCGGRDYADRASVWAVLDSMMPEVVIHGACQDRSGNLRGADRWADEWARKHAHMLLPVPALWDFYGNAAGPKRNGHMLALLQMMARNGKDPRTLVVAFPGGTGTEGMVSLAEAAGVEVLRG